MRTVRCAVIGAGSWATMAHLPALTSHTQAKVVAIQHHDPDCGAKVAQHFGVAKCYTSAEELLSCEEPEAVVVSSVPSLHYSQTKAALNCGCHVLVEKPMTIAAWEAEELMAIATERNRHFLLGATWHFTAHCQEVRRIVQAGELGDVKLICVLMSNATEGLYRGQPLEEAVEGFDQDQRPEFKAPLIEPGRTSYSDPELAGGGQIYCQTSHPAAYISFITEHFPAELFARFENDGAQVDVYNSINMKLDDGTLVALSTTGAAMPNRLHYEVRIFGTEGVLSQELWTGTLEVVDRRGKRRVYPQLAADLTYPMYAPAINLVDVVLGVEENLSPARHGVFSTVVSEAACKSARNGTIERFQLASRVGAI